MKFKAGDKVTMGLLKGTLLEIPNRKGALMLRSNDAKEYIQLTAEGTLGKSNTTPVIILDERPIRRNKLKAKLRRVIVKN